MSLNKSSPLARTPIHVTKLIDITLSVCSILLFVFYVIVSSFNVIKVSIYILGNTNEESGYCI